MGENIYYRKGLKKKTSQKLNKNKIKFILTFISMPFKIYILILFCFKQVKLEKSSKALIKDRGKSL